jgi:TolB-like protein
MKRFLLMSSLLVLVGNYAAAQDKDKATIYPIALLSFEDRGSKDAAGKVTDLLFAKLAANDAIYLVDRIDLKKALTEAELNLSGAVKNSEAIKVGQLTGAKLLITGSVIQVEKKTILVAKLIGTETSKVLGVSVEGKANDDLTTLVDQLAGKLGEKISDKASELVAKVVAEKDRIAVLKEKLKKGAHPSVFIQIGERHVGLPRIDPAAQTELTLFAKETGFTVVDDEDGMKSKADYIIKGEGISETATRNGNLVTVKSRVEVKVVDRKTDKVVAVDRQTVVTVDLTEQIAGKSALQEAAAQIAERLLPKLVKE